MGILRDKRLELGLTYASLAEKVGTYPSQIQKLERGDRRMSREWAERLAPHLETTAEALVFDGEADAGQTLIAPPRLGLLKVVGEVAAGLWHDPAAQLFEEYDYPAIVDPRFPADKQFLLLVRGDSINRQAPNGSLVRCLDIYAIEREPKHGDWVIVEHARADGTVETTVKQFRISPDGLHQYWPDSTNERWQAPVELRCGEFDTVRVAAYVLDFIRPATIL